MKMKRNMVLQLAVALILLFAILTFSMIFYIDKLNENFERELIRTLEEVSYQGAEAVRNEIESKEKLLSDLTTMIEVDTTQDSQVILQSVQQQLKPVIMGHDFFGMGVALKDGTAYSSTGSVYDVSEQMFFQEAIKGQSVISGRISNKQGQYLNIYATPIYDKDSGEIDGVLYATYLTENFRSTMEISFFHGEGYSYLVEPNGDVVVDSMHATSFQDMTNVYTSMENSDERNVTSIEQLQNYMANNQSGKLIFYNKIGKYMYCTPIGVNDWYLLTVVPVSVVDNQMDAVLRNTIILVVVLAGIFISLLALLIHQQRAKRTELLMLAYVDPITGGDTYAKFQLNYKRAMEECPNDKFAFLAMDLNRFKMINDLYGTAEGDKVIWHMNDIWTRQLREYEYCGHRMADRFVVLLRYHRIEELEERVQSYLDALQETAKNRYKISLRVGVYLLEDTSVSFATAHSRSMMAFAKAKSSENHFLSFYDEHMEKSLMWEKHVEDIFQTALQNGEFVVFYQAKVDTETKQVSGAEALVRWVRPDGTIIPPGKFIPILENNGTIAKLDQYVFQEVCRQQQAWLEEGRNVVPVSVNLSRVQLADRTLVDTYQQMLEETGVPSQYVGLEFTESAMFDNEEILQDTVDRLHKLGIKVLIDDFGVGYSSMMSLKAIPVDILKMDKSFIDSIGDERGNKIVISIIEFALTLGMRVTAEGVENDQQYRFLRNHRCNDIQGYYFARPVPAEEYQKKYLG